MSTLPVRPVLLACIACLSACTVVTSQPNQPPAGGAAGANGMTPVGTSGASGAGAGAGASNFPEWTNVTSNLIDLDTECGNLSTLATKPDEDVVIAGVAKQGLWSSTDGGGTWQQMGDGAASDMIIHRPTSFVFDPDDAKRFWESGIYGSAVYETSDDGKTLKQLGDASHCDLVSVDLSDSKRQTLLAGGHEQSQTLNLSADGGKTWASVGATLPDKTNCTFPLIIDSTSFLVGCGGYGGGVTGIYRSTDGGAHWKSVSTYGGGAAPLLASDGTVYWPNPYPGGLARSDDGGKTWMQVADGNAVAGYPPVELPDGRIASLDTHTVIVSADRGMTWQPASSALPYGDSRGLAYSAQQKAFFLWRVTCDDTSVHVPADAVMRADFDYEKQ